MNNDRQSQLITYGHVTFSRVISDGDHGNVRAERSIPILLPHDAVREEIEAATDNAWTEAVREVSTVVNEAFEREERPAPMYDGPRFHVVTWRPDRHLLLIIPAGEGDRVPGGVGRSLTYHEGHRLPMARRMADRLMATGNYSDAWEFSDGDYDELKQRHQEVLAQHERERAGDHDAVLAGA